MALWRKLQQSLSGGQAAVSEPYKRIVRPQLSLWHCGRKMQQRLSGGPAAVQKGLCGHSWHCRRHCGRKLQQSLSGGQAVVSEPYKRIVRPQVPRLPRMALNLRCNFLSIVPQAFHSASTIEGLWHCGRTQLAGSCSGGLEVCVSTVRIGLCVLEGKALGGATAAKTKVHTRGGPGRRPALARARQGRRIMC